MPHHLTDDMRECIDRCQACEEICHETVRHCLEKGGRHAAAEHIVLLLDCADICATSAAFMSRASDQHARVCDVCAEACDRCAESCEAMRDDEAMRRCAEECRRCAESCRAMAGVQVRR